MEEREEQTALTTAQQSLTIRSYTITQYRGIIIYKDHRTRGRLYTMKAIFKQDHIQLRAAHPPSRIQATAPPLLPGVPGRP
eukprot:6865708-Pyramimonas_sp.AAC.1